jgi:hypothetical protein
MHRLWIIIGSLAAVAVLGFGTLNIVSLLAHEEVTERATFDATSIEVIDVDAEHGSVDIVGVEGDEIRLVAEISHGLRRTSHRAEVEGSRLVLRSSCPWPFTWCHVDYRLEVPVDLAVVVNVDNGHVAIRDIDGPVDVDNDNGSVELIRLRGGVTAGTDNGSIEGTGLESASVLADSDNGGVALAFAAAPTTVQATTDNGSVEIVLPRGDETYRVDVDTSHGGTDVGVRTDPASDRVIVGRTSNGSVRVHYATG